MIMSLVDEVYILNLFIDLCPGQGRVGLDEIKDVVGFLLCK